MGTQRIATWNVNGIRSCSQKGLWEYVRQANLDALCLQETKAHPDLLTPEIRNPLGLVDIWSSAARRGYSGVALLAKIPFLSATSGIGIRQFDSEGRFAIAKFNDFDLYSIYFPNGSSSPERQAFKMEFLARLKHHFARQIELGRECIVTGDYNVAYLDEDVFDPVSLSKESGFLPEERAWFGEFLSLGFVDAYRHFHPKKRDAYTWWSFKERARATNRGWRIDHICVTIGLSKRLVSCEILPDQFGSDHCPVVVEMETS